MKLGYGNKNLAEGIDRVQLGLKQLREMGRL
jgi:hypothetical protein